MVRLEECRTGFERMLQKFQEESQFRFLDLPSYQNQEELLRLFLMKKRLIRELPLSRKMRPRQREMELCNSSWLS